MEALILFDGVCNFCNSSVQFVIKHDAAGYFKYAPLQGKNGQRILAENNMPISDFDTFILSEQGRIYQKSTAALRVARKLNGLWPLLYVFIIVPPFIRNFFYGLIAKNRYKLFGKKDACMIPSPEIRSRFLD